MTVEDALQPSSGAASSSSSAASPPANAATQQPNPSPVTAPGAAPVPELTFDKLKELHPGRANQFVEQVAEVTSKGCLGMEMHFMECGMPKEIRK